MVVDPFMALYYNVDDAVVPLLTGNSDVNNITVTSSVNSNTDPITSSSAEDRGGGGDAEERGRAQSGAGSSVEVGNRAGENVLSADSGPVNAGVADAAGASGEAGSFENARNADSSAPTPQPTPPSAAGSAAVGDSDLASSEIRERREIEEIVLLNLFQLPDANTKNGKKRLLVSDFVHSGEPQVQCREGVKGGANATANVNDPASSTSSSSSTSNANESNKAGQPSASKADRRKKKKFPFMRKSVKHPTGDPRKIERGLVSGSLPKTGDLPSKIRQLGQKLAMELLSTTKSVTECSVDIIDIRVSHAKSPTKAVQPPKWLQQEIEQNKINADREKEKERNAQLTNEIIESVRQKVEESSQGRPQRDNDNNCDNANGNGSDVKGSSSTSSSTSTQSVQVIEVSSQKGSAGDSGKQVTELEQQLHISRQMSQELAEKFRESRALADDLRFEIKRLNTVAAQNKQIFLDVKVKGDENAHLCRTQKVQIREKTFELAELKLKFEKEISDHESLKRHYEYRKEEKQDLELANRRLQKKIEKLEDAQSLLCVICVNARRDVAFLPCSHLVACQSCATETFWRHKKECPVCRTKITGSVAVKIA